MEPYSHSTVAGNGTEAADAQAGERLTLDHVLGQAKLAADDADFVKALSPPRFVHDLIGANLKMTHDDP